VQSLDDFGNRKVIDIQLELESGQDDIDLVVADSWYSTDGTRDSTLAATAWQTVNNQHKAFEGGWSAFNVTARVIYLV
jgi:hypothetical protein